MKKLRAIVSGRVQGVGFRYFVQKAAGDLDLTGWARNLPDGSVEVEAEGEDDKLEQFRRKLQLGPALSRVDDVKESFSESDGNYSGFSVR
jgi:acylphosphatase